MRLPFRLAAFAAVVALAFGAAYASTRWRSDRAAAPAGSARVSRSATESEKLAALGVRPGRQLIAYVLVSSRCGYCQRDDTRAALRALRDSLRRNNAHYAAVSVIGVAINRDFREGLGYLEGVGLHRFDEISVGRTWLNEHLNTITWRDVGGTATVPQVVLVERELGASFADVLRVRLSPDTVVGRRRGYKEIVEWVRAGADASVARSNPAGASDVTGPTGPGA